MPIIYNAAKKQFYLNTAKTSYIIEIFKEKYLIHRYWGKTLSDMPTMPESNESYNYAFSTIDIGDDRVWTTGSVPGEYPFYGTSDMREPAVLMQFKSGSTQLDPAFKDYEIIDGKPPIKGLPSSRAKDGEVKTLKIHLKDDFEKISIYLYYSVFEKCDVIARHAEIVNESADSVFLKRVASSCIDFFDNSLEMIHFPGQWSRERHIERVKPAKGTIRFDSKRGCSGPVENPLTVFAEPNADETRGDVYAVNLLYSGSFETIAQLDSLNTLRTISGINSFNFSWELHSGETFSSPEAVLTYSENGFGDMSRKMHRFCRDNICRGKYQYIPRPVLVNNWEATYFNFNEEKLLQIAEKAKEAGIDMLVLDDGWFGKRNSDRGSLGDWFCNTDKLPDGLSGFGKKLNDMGLKFGLWFEPEMISRDSDLYRQHPDWCIHIDGRTPHEGRWQLVLDLSRKEVREYIIDVLTQNLSSAPIAYVKWDMNRPITDVPNTEITHRYMLGLYEILETVMSRFPDVLFEGCAGGGGRFDLGMLSYFPQFWCSDDTDAVERLYIQYGTSFGYPSCTMGAHVSACPNHQVGRTTPYEMRGNVAMSGQFGYELDLSKLTPEETELTKQQVKFFKEHRKTIHYGDMYRLVSPFENDICSWEFISENGDEALFFAFVIRGKSCTIFKRIKLQGLDPEAYYLDESDGRKYQGAFLMQSGIPFYYNQDCRSELHVLKRL